MNTSHRTSRRTFITQTALASTGFWLAGCATTTTAYRPRRISANEKLNIAGIGVGGKGAGDIAETSKGQNVVAICDVDDQTLDAAAKKYPGAKRYNDWRRLLEQKDIDAVTVSTPDHMHAPIAMSAMQLGKHVYVQKPMAHTIFEARQMRLAARRYGVVSQMGNQGHSTSRYRALVKIIQSGTIGKIKEAHAWSNRPIWPQGIERPAGSEPPPEWLHWDNWLGVAPTRPFVGAKGGEKKGRGPYHPFNWRGYLDFGTGALGDMGCHIIDPVVWSLGLGAPLRVWSDGPTANGETYPLWETIHWEFAQTRYTNGPTIQLTWYDGGKKAPRELIPVPESFKVTDNGSLYIGEKGTILCSHDEGSRLLPMEKFRGFKYPATESDDHYMQWTNACKGVGKATSHFDYSGPLTETVLLGTVAVRFPQQKLEWNSANLKFTNAAAANEHVHIKYRSGWEVKGL